MKTLFLCFSVICGLHSYGQKVLTKPSKEWTSCNNIVSRKEDEITGGKTITFQALTFTDPVYQGNAIASIQYTADTNGVALNIQYRGECIYRNSSIHLLFTDSTRITLTNKVEYNCYGEARIELNNYRDNILLLKELAGKQIKAIRIETAYTSTQRYFTDIESKNFMFLTNCVLGAIGK
jgi:hypothetical protein